MIRPTLIPVPAEEVRREFVETPFGQVHIRHSGTGSRSVVPLLLLHQSPASSLTYQELLPIIGAHRQAIAIDTPGFGETFRPGAPPSITDYARWIEAVPDALGFDRFDVMGLFTGAAIAAELAQLAPTRVRRLVLAGPPLFTPEQQAHFRQDAWPARPRADGTHLLQEWNRVMSRPMPGLAFERRCDAFNEFYRGGANAIWGEMAVSNYPLVETLPRLRQPTLILQPDGITGDGARAAALMQDATLVRIPHLSYSMLQVVPGLVATAVEAFLEPD